MLAVAPTDQEWFEQLPARKPISGMLVSGDDCSDERCVICKVGQLSPGRATLTFDDDDGLTVVIRHVPAIGVCDSCGGAYFDEETARAVLTQVPTREGRGVVVLDYAA